MFRVAPAHAPAPAPAGAARTADPNEPRNGIDSVQFPPHFSLVFTREYGYSKYRRCTLEIDLFLKSTRATLECDPTGGGEYVAARRELTDDEAGRLRRLTEAADLFGPDHIGEDLTPMDGTLETLRFRPVAGGRAAVLVTSGNRSFVDQDARRDLLRLLKTIESDLSGAARPSTRRTDQQLRHPGQRSAK
jgi:hypothetical protein